MSKQHSPSPTAGEDTTAALAQEQAYVDMLFAHLDEEIRASKARLDEVMLDVDVANPDPEALLRRETEYHELQGKLDRLTLAGLGLVFGQISISTSPAQAGLGVAVEGRPGVERRYIGRMGIDDRQDNYRTLLLDWRAPAARPFYLATTARPLDVHRRRHIRTRGRTVVGIDDEILDEPDSVLAQSDTQVEESTVVSERALYRALSAARTEHMPTIVETIQSEQDNIIRDPTRGVLVVEGSPGTGKTAVALHRVAYLLYTWRDQLEKTGVLIIGPNPTFLSYISRVLPELGETGVVLSTIGELYPGVVPVAEETLEGMEIKGSEEMVTILKAAVADYRQVHPGTVLVDRTHLEVTAAMVSAAMKRARLSRQPHNDARSVFREALVESMAKAYAEILFEDPLGPTVIPPAEVAQLHDEILELPAVEEFIDSCWPTLEPEQVLAGLLSDKEAIARAAADYDEFTQDALWREVGNKWTASDAALIDELAEIIGVVDPEKAREQEQRQWRDDVDHAQEALDILTSSATQDLDDGFDAEILQAHDVIDAESLAARHTEVDGRTTAQRARADQRWAFGHVIVDEAQELTPMEWRMVMRRCPSRWMTLVGDTAQTSSPAGVDSWADTLAPYVASRFRHHELTVNYRTPGRIMDLAQQLLPTIAPEQSPATALRRGDADSVRTTTLDDLPAHLERLRAADPHRSIAVICAADATAHLSQLVGDRADTVASVHEVKGLEFDHVIVVNLAEMVEHSPQGWQDAYVALTRATQSLTIVGALPDGMELPGEDETQE